MLKALVILNPAAGKKSSEVVNESLARHFTGVIEYHVYETKKSDKPGDIVRARLRDGFDLVVAAGGDGTVSAVADGLVGSSVSLGIIPVGTGERVVGGDYACRRQRHLPVTSARICPLLLGTNVTIFVLDIAMRHVLFVTFLSAVSLSAPSQARGESPPDFVTSWGDSGTANGQFDRPVDIAVDSKGNIYITDLNNQRVQKFDRDGTFLLKWGTQGAGNGQFSYPVGIALDGQDRVYVVDSGNHRIQKFNTSGTFLGKWGSAGGGNGQFWNPQSVTVSTDGTIYVADTFNNRIEKFTSGGAFMLAWGSAGPNPGQFMYPTGIATDSQGRVYVTDLYNDRVEKFSSDSTLVTTWGSFGAGVGQFNRPFDLAVDKANKVYVADGTNHRIQKFDADGAFILTWGSQGKGNGQFRFPQSLTVVGQDTIYVTDTGNYRIQKFVAHPNPVTLSYLTAERRDPAVVIRWEVNDFAFDQVTFRVYRGYDDVTRAPLKGQRRYTFVDAHAPRAAVTYWLEEVDADGAVIRHGPIEVGAASALPLKLTAFPNPFKPATTLRYTVPTESQVSLAIYTVSGERVATLLDGETRPPDRYEYHYRSSLPSGIYFVRLTVGNKSTAEKILVLR